MITKIKRQDYPQHFHWFVHYENIVEDVDDDHDSGIFRCKTSIVKITDKKFPQFPELWGFWLTEEYQWSSKYGSDIDAITTLTRVEQKTRTIEEKYWAPVKPNEQIPTPI